MNNLVDKLKKRILTSASQSAYGIFKKPQLHVSEMRISSLTGFSIRIVNQEHLGGIAKAMDAGGYDKSPSIALEKAYYEAVERYSTCIHTPNKIIYRISFQEIDSRFYTTHPSRYASPLANKYLKRKTSWKKFEENSTCDWVLVNHAWKKEQAALPISFVFYLPLQNNDQLFSFVSTNGCAFGWSLENAKLSSVLELIERDSFILHWRDKNPGFAIEIDSHLVKKFPILDSFGKNSLSRLRIHFLRNEFSVPVVCCSYWGDGLKTPGLYVCAAAALDPSKAVEKALTELGQGLSGEARNPQSVKKIDLKAVDEKVLDFPDHAHFYFSKENAKLAKFWQKKKRTISYEDFIRFNRFAPKTLSAVVRKFQVKGYDLYFFEFENQFLKKLSGNVVRAIAPSLINIEYLHFAKIVESKRFQFKFSNRNFNQLPHPFP